MQIQALDGQGDVHWATPYGLWNATYGLDVPYSLA
jgi:hypothetical protein